MSSFDQAETRRLHPVERHFFAWILVAFAAFYVIAYLASGDLPAGSGEKSGWWFWFDQGEYLKSARAIAQGQFSAGLHNYPPLYSAMAALVIHILPVHPFFPIDIIAFIVFVGALLWIAGRLYGLSVALIATIAIMILAPAATIRQWVVPWTTTMSGLLISLQLLAAWRFHVADRPWRVETRRDWLWVVLFFLCYSGLAATRPLDFIAFLPLAIAVFVKLELAAWAGPRRGVACLRLLAVSVAVCAICAALLIAFNLRTYGTYTSAYIWRSGDGYSIATVPQKLYSLFLHSHSIYADYCTALFEKLPLFSVVFAVVLVALFTAKPFVKAIILLGLFQILLYLPFPDLMPTALFRFGEIHYFKWILMWFPVIALGEVFNWFRLPASTGGRLGRAVAVVALLLLFTQLKLVPVLQAEADSRRDIAAGTLDIGPVAADNVSYIDIPRLTGDRRTIYLTDNPLTLNGTPLAMVREYRFIPYGDGVRLVFLRPQSVQTIHIAFNAENKLGAGDDKLSLMAMKLGFGREARPTEAQAASSRW